MDQLRTLDELGYYLLAGGATDPSKIVDEAVAGEALGLGTAFVSERFNLKELGALSGAACAVTSEMTIALGTTNHNLRHPIVFASWATTLHRLSGGRFMPGIGRGIAPIQQAFGIPPITTAQMEDFVGLMRRLWQGEVVFNHDGPAGSWPILHLDASFDEDIKMSLVAFGPESLALGGRAFDAVILHTFFTEETLQRSVATVKQAAERAERDPDQVRVWSCLATVEESIDEESRLRKTVGRLATYLQGYGDLLVTTNRWDPGVLERFRADETVTSIPGAIDALANIDQLEHVATLLPDDWLEPAATGSATNCAARIRREMDLGADAVIMHGASPSELDPVVAAYREAEDASAR
jgi:probable F420-dependent oxidoreductase